MTTKKQIEANRRNAKKSTGPRTPEGKARSAQNATKHGLTSRRVVLADEDAAHFNELRINLYEDLAPEGQLEGLLVNRIAAVQWRLARIPALEAELFDNLRADLARGPLGLGEAWANDEGPYGGALTRLSRYETMLERSALRLQAELRRLQAERRKRESEALTRWLNERQARQRESPMDRLRNEADPLAYESPPSPVGEAGRGDEAPARQPGAGRLTTGSPVYRCEEDPRRSALAGPAGARPPDGY